MSILEELNLSKEPTHLTEEQLKLGNKVIYYEDYRDVPSGYNSKVCKMKIEE